MKIALVILHADPARGGAERYTADLAEALRRRGNDVSLLASDFPTATAPAGDVALPARGVTRAGRYRDFLRQLDRHLSEVRYDVVHAMLPVPRCDVYHPHAGIAAEAVGAGHLKYAGPLRQTLARLGGNFNFRRRKFAAVERELLTSADPPVVLCLSRYIQGFVRRYYDLPPAKLATLFNAVDLERFDPAARPNASREIRERFGISPEKIVALMIAQDFERKGLDEAVRAVAQIPDPRLLLLVVGKPDPSPYRALANRLGVSDRVIFAGPTTDPYAFYRASNFFVLPTRHDPCSLVVLEALAMGLPVVSTVFNGACEVMTSGTHGFVLSDPGDAPALSEAMRQLVDDGTRRAMIDACSRLRPELSYDRHVDQLIQIYRNPGR